MDESKQLPLPTVPSADGKGTPTKFFPPPMGTVMSFVPWIRARYDKVRETS